MIKPHPIRQRALVLVFVLLLIGQSVLFLVRRLSTPADAANFVFFVSVFEEDGLAMTPLVEDAGGLRDGDVVVAVEGFSLDDWVADVLHRRLPRPDWQFGDHASYTVRRGEETITISQPLGRFPLGRLAISSGIWLNQIISIIFLGIACFLFFKAPDEPVARVLLLIAAAQPTTNFTWGITITDVVTGTGLIHYLLSTAFVFTLIWIGYLHFSLTFPRPLPWLHDRGWVIKFIYIFPIVFIVGWWLLSWQLKESALVWLSNASLPVNILLALYALLALVAILVAFVKARDPVGRAQMRWVVSATVLALVITIIGGTVAYLFAAIDFVAELFLFIDNFAFLLIPIAIVIAVLRYRLFDIDVIIRKTTSYAILTAMLALVYFSSIVVLQRLLTPVIGESDVAVVLSTLLIAALVLPVRRRVQDLIDRRFFRKKYDAEKVLQQFAATARDETDLDALTGELLRVIQETMQPEHVSIWLKPAEAIPTADERS